MRLLHTPMGSALYATLSPAAVVGDSAFVRPHGLRESHEVRDRLVALEKNELIFEWQMMLHGCYRVDAMRSPVEHVARVQEAEYGPTWKPHRLQCPTGRLVMANVWLEEPVELCRVEPGVYRIALRWDLEEEELHWELATVKEYPAGDGPDGVFYLAQVDAPLIQRASVEC